MWIAPACRQAGNRDWMVRRIEFGERLRNRQQNENNKGKKRVLRRSDFFSIIFFNNSVLKGNPF
jgi:hypothetical protein